MGKHRLPQSSWCAAASLLTCAAACVLWERSHRRNDQFWRGGDGRVLYSWAGAVRYADYHLDAAARGPATLPGVATPVDGDDPAPTRLAVPYPIAAAAAALPPAVWLARRTRAGRRSRRGACPSCGYDLTGNRSGACPECGTPVATGVKP